MCVRVTEIHLNIVISYDQELFPLISVQLLRTAFKILEKKKVLVQNWLQRHINMHTRCMCGVL